MPGYGQKQATSSSATAYLDQYSMIGGNTSVIFNCDFLLTHVNHEVWVIGFSFLPPAMSDLRTPAGEQPCKKLALALNAFPLGREGKTNTTKAEGRVFGRNGCQELDCKRHTGGCRNPMDTKKGHRKSQPPLQGKAHTKSHLRHCCGIYFPHHSTTCRIQKDDPWKTLVESPPLGKLPQNSHRFVKCSQNPRTLRKIPTRCLLVGDLVTNPFTDENEAMGKVTLSSKADVTN